MKTAYDAHRSRAMTLSYHRSVFPQIIHGHTVVDGEKPQGQQLRLRSCLRENEHSRPVRRKREITQCDR